MNKFRKKRNNAEAFENLLEIYLLRFQKAWNIFLKGPGARWRQKSTGKRRNMQKGLAELKGKKIRKMINNAGKCEYLAENELLQFQKAWNVYLKGAEALWSQKSTEKRRNMQKGLAVGRCCAERPASCQSSIRYCKSSLNANALPCTHNNKYEQ